MLPPVSSARRLYQNHCSGVSAILRHFARPAILFGKLDLYWPTYENRSRGDARVRSCRVDDHRAGDDKNVATRAIDGSQFTDDRAADRHLPSVESDVVA